MAFPRPMSTRSTNVFRFFAVLAALAIAGGLLVIPAAAAPIEELPPNDHRITEMGGSGDAKYAAFRPAIVYNDDADEYLVVWSGDDNYGALTDHEFEIFGQRLSGDGQLIGGRFRVSDMGPNGSVSFGAFEPAVAYNPADGEYLVVWHADDDAEGLADDEWEIFGQRLDADGVQVGANDFRISEMGPDGDNDYEAQQPHVTYNVIADEYMVVWVGDHHADGLVDDELEVFGQRLDDEGDPGGSNFRVSDLGGTGDSKYDAVSPAIVFNELNGDYLVVWTGDDDTNGLVNDEYEVFGQLLDVTGTETGGDFRISQMGGTGDKPYDTWAPGVTYNPTENEYLVVWASDDNAGGVIDGTDEIFGQRLDAAGSTSGTRVRISDMGPDSDDAYDAHEPAVAVSAETGNYLVVWFGSDDTDGLESKEWEVFAQLLDAEAGEQGADVRVSDMGGTGDPDFDGWMPDIANGGAGEFFAVWSGDDNEDGVVDDEFEIFGQGLVLADIECDPQTDPECEGFCELNPGDPVCEPVCDPQVDPECEGFCELNPGDPVCEPVCDPQVDPECEGFCELNPGDPVCEPVCDPQVDPECEGFCELNPDDPVCEPVCDPELIADCCDDDLLGGPCPEPPCDPDVDPGCQPPVCVSGVDGAYGSAWYSVVTAQGRGYNFGGAPEAFDFSGLLSPGEWVVDGVGTWSGKGMAVVTSTGRVLGQGDAPQNLGQVDLSEGGPSPVLIGIALTTDDLGAWVGFSNGAVAELNAPDLGDWTSLDPPLVEELVDFKPSFPSADAPADTAVGGFYAWDNSGGAFTSPTNTGGNGHLVNPFWFSLWDFPGLGDLRPQLRGPVNTGVVVQPDCDYELARYKTFAVDGGVFNAAKDAGEEGFTPFTGSGPMFYEDTLGFVPEVGSVPDFVDGDQWGQSQVLVRSDGLVMVNEGLDPTIGKQIPPNYGDAQGLLVPGDQAVTIVAYTPAGYTD